MHGRQHTKPHGGRRRCGFWGATVYGAVHGLGMREHGFRSSDRTAPLRLGRYGLSVSTAKLNKTIKPTKPSFCTARLFRQRLTNLTHSPDNVPTQRMRSSASLDGIVDGVYSWQCGLRSAVPQQWSGAVRFLNFFAVWCGWWFHFRVTERSTVWNVWTVHISSRSSLNSAVALISLSQSKAAGAVKFVFSSAMQTLI